MNFDMRYSSLIFCGVTICAGSMALMACKDSKSYAELLTDEAKAVNNFLANQNVILQLPADGNFIEGKDAPFYRLDDDGNVYMQVIDSGDKEQMAQDDELVYFRFTRYSLYNYNPDTGEMSGGWGNADDLSVGSASFRFGNYTLSSSSQWGSGIQLPLSYVGLESEVNLVIKSQYGLSSEISQVVPFYYNVRYFKQGTSNYPDEDTPND